MEEQPLKPTMVENFNTTQKNALASENKATSPSEIVSKSDEYLHEHPPTIYDGGLHTITSKYFKIIKDSYFDLHSIKFWNDSTKVYSDEIILETLNPYKDIRNLPIIQRTINEPQKSQIIYNISEYPNRQGFISNNYSPEYTQDNEVYSARIEFAVEELFNHFEKELIGITFSIEVSNQYEQVLGIETTYISFDKLGKTLNTLVVNTPMYYISTNKNGHFLGYIIGGFWGENFEIIYPETFRVYNFNEKKFILKNDEFIGLSNGGGCTDERFFLVSKLKEE